MAAWVLLVNLKHYKTHTEGNNMTNKNGFEIRADVLEMAKSYMDKQTELTVDYANRMQEMGRAQSSNFKEEFEKSFKLYSVEDLLTKAQEFYDFVEKK
jgi:hypothetical protein